MNRGRHRRAERSDAGPIAVMAYHGTNAPPFQRFDPSRRGSSTDDGFLGAGFYASTDPAVGRASKTTLRLIVRLERPLRLTMPTWEADKRRLVNDALGTRGLRGEAITREAERHGYDGVVLDYSPLGYRHQEVVAFDPDEIEVVGPIPTHGALAEATPTPTEVDWEDALVPGDARYVPASIRQQMPSVVARALAAGAPAGQLEFMGAGMTGVVLCAGDVAYKVARDVRDIDHLIFEEEAEWLQAVARVPAVARHVARFHRFDPENLVIERDCPKSDPDVSTYRYGEGRLHDLHRAIDRDMVPHGWTAPEFKPDSYVITKGGPILVDASMPSRVGAELAAFVEAVAAGDRPLWTVRPSDLAFHVRMESGRTLTEEEVRRLLDVIHARWPETATEP